ncbi:MAG: Kazal-type serine protease inhibitor domain-containing protein [Bacteroidota bacterium]
MQKQVLIILLLVTISITNYAQPCIDSLRRSPYFPCPDPTFKPVCGCDGITYRNVCNAEYQNGVNYYRDGSCSGLEFDIYPNFTPDNLNFAFVQPQNTTASANLAIVDAFGAMLYYKTIYPESLTGRVDLLITETQMFRPGVYIMFLYNGKGDYRFKKFVKY